MRVAFFDAGGVAVALLKGREADLQVQARADGRAARLVPDDVERLEDVPPFATLAPLE